MCRVSSTSIQMVMDFDAALLGFGGPSFEKGTFGPWPSAFAFAVAWLWANDWGSTPIKYLSHTSRRSNKLFNGEQTVLFHNFQNHRLVFSFWVERCRAAVWNMIAIDNNPCLVENHLKLAMHRKAILCRKFVCFTVGGKCAWKERMRDLLHLLYTSSSQTGVRCLLQHSLINFIASCIKFNLQKKDTGFLRRAISIFKSEKISQLCKRFKILNFIRLRFPRKHSRSSQYKLSRICKTLE